MSLKTFHILFIICSSLLGLAFSVWGFSNYQTLHTAGYLWAGIGSLILTGLLVVYGINFFKKLKEL